MAFQLENRTLPIVHRIHKINHDTSGKTLLRTKGDDNRMDDGSLYGQKLWLSPQRDIVGHIVGVLPKAGGLWILVWEHLGGIKHLLLARTILDGWRKGRWTWQQLAFLFLCLWEGMACVG